MQATARIKKEIQNMQKDEKVPGIDYQVDPSNMRLFHVQIEGPEGTPYDSGVFNLELFLP